MSAEAVAGHGRVMAPRRRLPTPARAAVAVASLLLVVAFVVAPDEGFRQSWNDWRHTEALGGQLRALDGPLEMRAQPATVSLGDAGVLIWGGRGLTPDSGAVYDPRTDRWDRLPPAPGPGRFAAASVWTGQEAVIWGGATDQRAFDFDPGGLAWNPGTRTWRTLPPAPFGLMGARAASFPGGVLFAGGNAQSYPSDPVSLWLDSRSGQWTQIPVPLVVQTTTWYGDTLLATGPPTDQPGRQPATGWPVLAFDPEALAWRSFAGPLRTQWMALTTAADGTLSAVSLDGINEPLRAWTWTDSEWRLVRETKRGAYGVVTIEPVLYSPVVAQAGRTLLLGGDGGLTRWDPDRQEFAHAGDGRYRTFGGGAVWTGEELVALSSQGSEGWVWRPDAAAAADADQ